MVLHNAKSLRDHGPAIMRTCEVPHSLLRWDKGEAIYPRLGALQQQVKASGVSVRICTPRRIREHVTGVATRALGDALSAFS